jgi:CubicO group peptidase (beta-lactamase class C family)
MARQSGQIDKPRRQDHSCIEKINHQNWEEGGMRRNILAVVFVASVATSAAWSQSLAPAKPEEVGLSSERLARMTQFFKQEVDQGRLPGAVVAIARKGRLTYFEAFGFRDKQEESPMPKDAVFRIYSMTKPLVSVAAMMLMEEGKLQLTDPVAKYLPAFAGVQVSLPKLDPFGKVIYATLPLERPMTVQDLLRHTAGLAYGELTANVQVKDAYTKAGVYRTDMDFDARTVTPDDEVAGMAKAPLVHQPGTVWEYSLAVDVLGRVVEKASGMQLSEYLEQRLFNPLKMADTGFHVPQNKMARLAQPLPVDPSTNTSNKLIDVSAQPKNDSGGAGGVSTAMDYLRFSQMMLNGGALDDARIISRTTVALMTSDHLGSDISTATMNPGMLLLGVPGYTFGLGFAVRKEPGIAGLPGSQGDYTWGGAAGTYFWVDPKEQLAAVMMTQSPGPTRPWYRRELRQFVYQAIAD